MKPTRSTRAFTLVEILIATVISVLLLTGLVAFSMQCANSLHASSQRMNLASDINRFTNELIAQGSRSNQVILYKTANRDDFNGPNDPAGADEHSIFPDRQLVLTVTPPPPDPSREYCPAGDFAVFVYYEFPKLTADPAHRIIKLEGYYLMGTDPTTGIGQVKKVVIVPSAAASLWTPEQILAANSTPGVGNWVASASVKVSTCFTMVRGMAKPENIDYVVATGTPRLFYMRSYRNVIVSGQLYSSNRDINTNDWRTFTNAFCFTITPRT